MPLLKDGRLIDDPWRKLADDEAAPAQGPILVSRARFAAERDALLARGAPMGVALANTDDVAALAADLSRLNLVALNFPKFSDGRAFSQARTLRERFGFAGELRATGHVLPDQLVHMIRCGFDAFELFRGEPLAAWRRAQGAYSAFYQPAADGRSPLADLRRRFAPRPLARLAGAAP
jgi:uncharacterized protein (DUF934 family)